MPQKKSAPIAQGALRPILFHLGPRRYLLRFGLCTRVVLLVVDILRRAVLFLVDLLLFRTGQLPAIGRPVRMHLLVDAALLILELSRFAGGELPALDAIGNAILLVLTTLPHD